MGFVFVMGFFECGLFCLLLFLFCLYVCVGFFLGLGVFGFVGGFSGSKTVYFEISFLIFEIKNYFDVELYIHKCI